MSKKQTLDDIGYQEYHRNCKCCKNSRIDAYNQLRCSISCDEDDESENAFVDATGCCDYFNSEWR